uniref:Tetratricopeptide TPR_2 repeat protein n=1 Tax=Cyanothece sp. (strain PCC 7425 / ATCC 29141) TaxID=395961 RepID=B8HN26_CYAP4
MHDQLPTPSPDKGAVPTSLEVVTVVAGLGGAIATVITQQVLLAAAASASLSIAAGLNLLNRQRLLQGLRQDQQTAITSLVQRYEEQQQRLEHLSHQLAGVEHLTSDLSRDAKDLHDYAHGLGTEQKQIETVVGCLREIETCTLAIQREPNDGKAYYNRGLTHQRLGDLAAAIADYTAAIHLNPDCARAYHNRGVALSRQGHRQAALEDLRAAAKHFFERGDLDSYQKARDLSKQLHQLEPAEPAQTADFDLAVDVLFA